MPFKECLRLDDDQSFTPIEEPGEQDHERARDSGGTSRLDLAFLKQCELFAKKQILGNDCSVGERNNRINVNNPKFYKSSQPLPTKLGSNYCGAQAYANAILQFF